MNPQHDRTDLAHRLIVRAAHRAPATLCERLEEEWLADLRSRTSAASRLRLALGCSWATVLIAREFRVPQLAAAGAAAGHKSFLAGLRYDMPLLSRRTIAFLAIAAIHVVLIYAFISGMTQHLFTSSTLRSQGFVVMQPEVQSPPPPPATIKLRHVSDADLYPEPPQVEVAPAADPQVLPPLPPDGKGDGIVDQRPSLQPEPPPVQRVVGGPGKGFPNTDDYYPAASRRLSETGAATVQVCVDDHGRLNGDPSVTRSSGNRRIDEGALNLAKAGSGHYRPTLEDGQSVSSCFPYRIRFTLGN